MKRRIPLLFLFAALIFGGCGTPAKTAQKKLDAVTKAKADEQANQDKQIEKAAGLVAGTGMALDRAPGTNVAVRFAKDLNGRAQAVVGAPKYADAVTMSGIVDGATSGDAKQEKAARDMLTRFDSSIGVLQQRIEDLEKTRAIVEQQRDDSLLSYAKEATTWRGIKHVFFWAILGIVLIAVVPIALNLLGQVNPAFGVFSSIAGKMVGVVGKAAVRIVPAAAHEAGLVAIEVHNKVQAAAEDLSAAVAKLKKTDPAGFAATVAPTLKTLALARAGTPEDPTAVLNDLKNASAKAVV